jgi:magnesium transporter
VYGIFDGLTDAYYPVISALEEQIDALEEEVLSHPRRELLTKSYRLKQSVRDLHRLVAAQSENFGVGRDAILNLPGFARSSKPYLRDVGDHLHQVAGEFMRQAEDLISLTQTYYNANADRLNATATRITIGGTIFVVWTVVTGFFGQNFGWLVDKIDTRHAFLVFGLGGLIVPTVILLTVFWVKRHDWF